MSVNVDSERRKYPRVDIDLPIRYSQADEFGSRYGRAMNVSEGGLLVYSPEQMDIDQLLKSKIFFLLDSKLDTIEMETQVVWTDLDLNEAWGDYRSGLRLIDISAGDMRKLNNLLLNLHRDAPAAG